MTLTTRIYMKEKLTYKSFDTIGNLNVKELRLLREVTSRQIIELKEEMIVIIQHSIHNRLTFEESQKLKRLICKIRLQDMFFERLTKEINKQIKK